MIKVEQQWQGWTAVTKVEQQWKSLNSSGKRLHSSEKGWTAVKKVEQQWKRLNSSEKVEYKKYSSLASIDPRYSIGSYNQRKSIRLRLRPFWKIDRQGLPCTDCLIPSKQIIGRNLWRYCFLFVRTLVYGNGGNSIVVTGIWDHLRHLTSFFLIKRYV